MNLLLDGISYDCECVQFITEDAKTLFYDGEPVIHQGDVLIAVNAKIHSHMTERELCNFLPTLGGWSYFFLPQNSQYQLDPT